jgi:hypothetical protein
MGEQPASLWLAFKPCGCLVGAAKHPDPQQDDAVLLEWLHDGLTVQRVPWAEWTATYRARLLEDCPHESAPASAAVGEAPDSPGGSTRA